MTAPDRQQQGRATLRAIFRASRETEAGVRLAAPVPAARPGAAEWERVRAGLSGGGKG